MTYGVSTNRRWDSSVAVPIFCVTGLSPRAARGTSRRFGCVETGIRELAESHNINLLNLRKHFTETATDQPALAGKHEVDAFELTQVVHGG